MNTIVVENIDYGEILSDEPYSDDMCKEFIFDMFKILCKDYEKEIVVNLVDGLKEGKFETKYRNGRKIFGNWKFEKGVPIWKTIYVDWNDGSACEILNESLKEHGVDIDYNTFKEGMIEQIHFKVVGEISDIIFICNYIMSVKRNKTIKSKIKKNIINGDNADYKGYNPKKINLLDEIIYYVSKDRLVEKTNSGRKINCDCWGVRGHYRHYKSGKVVFIKEYKKGKNRADKEPKSKTYVV